MGGPSLEEQYKAAAFAVVMYGEDEATKSRSFQGWAGGQVEVNPESEGYNGATKVDAINAERSAILLALKIVNGRRRHCNYEICFDNQAAGYGADGTWRTDQASDIACRIRLLTLLIQQQGGKIRFQHVKAHSNQPQNDVADALAKLINLGKIRGTSTHGNARTTTSATLHQLLLVAGAGSTFPMIKDKTMWWKHEAKAAPTTIDIPLTSPFDRRWVNTIENKGHSLNLRLMSYNVLTLRPWKVNGHDPDAAMPQKAALLAQQLIARQVNIAGLQETRNSQSGVFKHDGVYRMVAQGTKHGTHGCEIWINLTVPLANIAGRPFFVDPSKITVVESEPTKIFAQIELPGLTLTVASVHAPQSGQDQTYREQWWKELAQSISKHRKDLLCVLGDYNATMPEAMENMVGNLVCEKKNANTHLLQQLLIDSDIWAPATYEACHRGDRHTWTHHIGKKSRLDYILVDRGIAEGECWSFPMHGIEIGNPVEDHGAVGLEVQWEWKSKHGVKVYKQVDWLEVGKEENASKVRELIDSIPQCPWHVDIHDHMQYVQNSVTAVLAHEFPLKKKTARKTYISEETWMLRKRKLWMRSTLWHYHKNIDVTHRLRFAMGKLRHEGGVRQWMEAAALVLAEKMIVAAHRDAAKQMERQLRKDRDAYVETVADDIRDAKAIDVHKALDRLKGSSKYRKRGRQQLPMLLGENGPAQSQSERAKIWQVCTIGSGLLYNCRPNQAEMPKIFLPSGAKHTTADHQWSSHATRIGGEAEKNQERKSTRSRSDQIGSLCHSNPGSGEAAISDLDEANALPGRAHTVSRWRPYPGLQRKGPSHRGRKLQKPPALQSLWKEHERGFPSKGATLLHPRVVTTALCSKTWRKRVPRIALFEILPPDCQGSRMVELKCLCGHIFSLLSHHQAICSYGKIKQGGPWTYLQGVWHPPGRVGQAIAWAEW